MRIEAMRVQNYESFEDSGWVQFNPSVAFVVGENNSGKSALLRSLRPSLAGVSHRNEKRYLPEHRQVPSQTVQIAHSGMEYLSACLKHSPQVYWPNGAARVTLTEIERYLSEPHHVTELRRTSQSGFETQTGEGGTYVTFRLDAIEVGNATSTSSFHLPFGGMWTDSVFVFDAQRFALGKSPFAYEERLAPNALNLAGILSRLRGEQNDIFELLVSHLREIFTTVNGISISPTKSGHFEIRIWPTEHQSHIDLSFPLDDSGTGISQAIAILTIAMTMQVSVIVVDEITAFLHPSAAKKMLKILFYQYPQHQYIVSTHSMDIVSITEHCSVHLVDKKGYSSSVSTIDRTSLAQLRSASSALGTSVTDFFVYSNIIWVEGPTEEVCFSYIYETYFAPVPSGVTFRSVSATGDFSSRKRNLVLDIYSRISDLNSQIPSSAIFSFDRERLSETQMGDFSRQSKGRAYFLPRRNIECYIVNPNAISRFIGATASDLDDVEVLVTNFILEHGGDPKYGAAKLWTGSINDRHWLREVDAANLIRDVCLNVSDGRVDFSKVYDTATILRYTRDIDGESLNELASFVHSLIVAAVEASS